MKKMKNDQSFLEECPICESKKLKRDYEFEDFYVLTCKDCKNSWRSNMYNEEKIEEIYCIDDYEENPYFSYDLESVKNLKNNRFTNYRKALELAKHQNHSGKLLDIGCGHGTFLAMAKEYGWGLTGIEISEELSKACKENVPDANIINKRFEEANLEPNQFSLITMWDVIEHVIDPIDVISNIKELLIPGGIALFCTPDESSSLAKLGKILYNMNLMSYPALALHPPNHTYFFSRTGFKNIIKQLDMTVENSYSQAAFFEHSEMASGIQKLGISMIEGFSKPFDAQYEMVVIAKKSD